MAYRAVLSHSALRRSLPSKINTECQASVWPKKNKKTQTKKLFYDCWRGRKGVVLEMENPD
jgi:hypothetical protein